MKRFNAVYTFLMIKQHSTAETDGQAFTRAMYFPDIIKDAVFMSARTGDNRGAGEREVQDRKKE